MKKKMKWLSIAVCVLFISTTFSGAIDENSQRKNTLKELNQNLVPINVEITKPKQGYFYFNDREVIPLGLATLIIGPIIVEVSVDSDTTVDRVEFYIDDELRSTDYLEPYEWYWSDTVFLKHTIKVIAYTYTGETASDEIQVHMYNYNFKPPVASLDISATTPHLADGEDASEVLVVARDSNGKRVEEANIFTSLSIGEDISYTVEAEYVGYGKYISYLNSTYAGDGMIVATDITTGISASAPVEFVPGHTVDISFFPIEIRDSYINNGSRRCYDVMAVARDSFLNRVGAPLSDISFSTDFGEIISTYVDEYNVYHAIISSEFLGYANVTVTDIISGFSDTIQLVFPAVILGGYLGTIFINETFSVPIEFYIEPQYSLKEYTLTINFDEEFSDFMYAVDGDPDDVFEVPSVEVIAPGTLHVSQSSVDSSDLPSGIVYAADLVFHCNGVGISYINISETELFGGPCGQVLLDVFPEVNGECGNKPKDKCLCINFIVVKGPGGVGGSTVTEEDCKNAIKKLQQELNDKDACCTIWLCYRFNTINFKEELDQRKTVGRESWLSDDYKKLFLDFKDKRDDKCINVYFVKKIKDYQYGQAIVDLLLKRAGKPGQPGVDAYNVWKILNVTGKVIKDDTGKTVPSTALRGVVIDETRNDGSQTSKKKMLKTFIHEIGHMLCLPHPGGTTNLDDDGTDNVMQSCTEDATKLTRDQCKIIMENKHGFLQDDFPC